MRPASNSTTSAANTSRFGHWNSPMPYLFGGLLLMLGLIAMALVILACSYLKSSSNSHGDGEEKPSAKQVEMQEADLEPKIVVIMAGNQNPTYLANPTVSSTYHHAQQAV